MVESEGLEPLSFDNSEFTINMFLTAFNDVFNLAEFMEISCS